MQMLTNQVEQQSPGKPDMRARASPDMRRWAVCAAAGGAWRLWDARPAALAGRHCAQPGPSCHPGCGTARAHALHLTGNLRAAVHALDVTHDFLCSPDCGVRVQHLLHAAEQCGIARCCIMGHQRATSCGSMMGGALGMHMGASTTSTRPTPPGCEATPRWLHHA